jgi:tetratricopeptide (TPR) repeat protein
MDPSNPDASALHARELLDRRRTAQAREVLQAAIALHPDDAGLLLQAARADLQDGRSESAEATLSQLLGREPGHVGARLLMLWLLTESKRLQEAEAMALSLLREHPQSADLYASYARVMLAALHLPKARALASEALRLEPDNELALRALALGDIVEAPGGANHEALRRLLTEHPEDQDTLALMVVALVHRHRLRAALRGAQELLRMQPNDPRWLRLVRELRVSNHWTMRPLWPVQRFGWYGSIALWAAFIVLSRATAQAWPALSGALTLFILVYVVYSWVWPPLLRRLMMRD